MSQLGLELSRAEAIPWADLEFGVSGLGFRVSGLGFRVSAYDASSDLACMCHRTR